MVNMLSDKSNVDMLLGLIGAAFIYVYAYWYFRKE
jgi:hypothetical protein